MLWELFNAFRSGDMSDFNMAGWLLELAAVVFVVLFCLSAHECAHAWAAKKLGDNTAYNHGRLTLNPSKHLDPIGALMILLVGFGYAKPVPVNPRNFKHYKKGMALTAAAGPISNLIMAFIFAVIFQIFLLVNRQAQSDLTLMLTGFWLRVFYTNVGLAVFNLLPIPPLDGSRLLDLALPMKASLFLSRYERYLRYGILALLFFGVLTTPLNWLTGHIADGIMFLARLPFGLFN